MDQIILEVGEETEIIIDGIGGDLRLTGWDQGQFSAESDEDRSLHVSQDGTKLRVHANADCRLRVPESAMVALQNVGGDARVKNVQGPLGIGRVGGDLNLRQVGDTGVAHVGGDLKAKNVDGGLRLDAIGGDVQASRVAGPLTARSIGGDLYLRDVEGAIDVQANGDVAVNVTFEPELGYTIRAGGDLTCRLNPNADVRLDVNGGGDIEVDVPGAQISGQPHQRSVLLGAGTATVSLQARGDVAITGAAADPSAMGDFGEQFGDDLGVMAEEFASQMENQINAQIESMMPDWDKLLQERMANLQMQFGAGSPQAEEIAAKARRAAEKIERATERQADKARRRAEAAVREAEREAERARRRAEQNARHHSEHAKHVRHAWNFGPRPPMPPTPPMPPRAPVPPMPPTDPVTDEERMVILRMVEQGKISVADAEKLLAALENR